MNKPLIYFFLILLTPSVWADWEQVDTPNPPPARGRHTMVQHGSNLYVFGGGNHETTYNDIWVWDGNAWTKETPKNSPPPARHSHSATVSNGRMQIAFGRAADGSLLGDMWEYDFAQKNWFPVTANSTGITPQPRYNHTLTYVPSENKIYVLGGISGKGKTNELLSFNPTTREWQQEEPYPASIVVSHQALVRDGKVLVVGGYTGTKFESSVREFTPGSGWSTIEPVGDTPPGRGLHAAALDGDQLHIIGGFDSSGDHLKDHWVFDVDTNSWDSKRDFPQSVSGAILSIILPKN